MDQADIFDSQLLEIVEDHSQVVISERAAEEVPLKGLQLSQIDYLLLVDLVDMHIFPLVDPYHHVFPYKKLALVLQG